jgi:hypothetical protein
MREAVSKAREYVDSGKDPAVYAALSSRLARIIAHPDNTGTLERMEGWMKTTPYNHRKCTPGPVQPRHALASEPGGEAHPIVLN